MKTNSLTKTLFLIIFVVNLGCEQKNETKDKSIDSVIINVQFSNAQVAPMLLFLDFNSSKIVICNTNLKTITLPPPPANDAEISSNEIAYINPEVIKVSNDDLAKLKKQLNNFTKDDFVDKKEDAYDGVGISINYVYSNSEIKEVNLINDSTEKQKLFFENLFEILSETNKHNADYMKKINFGNL